MGKEWIARWGLVLAVGGSVHACKSSQTVADTAAGGGATARVGATCLPGHAGCSCPTDGAVVNCGTMAGRHGDYVACMMGSSTCQGGHWGPCVGTTLVTKSLGRATIGTAGLHILSTTTLCPVDGPMQPPQCADPCDPNMYTVTENGPSDVDAAGVTTVDGAVTLGTPPVPCQGLGCQVASDCPCGVHTTLAGTVYDPAGNHPVYNATVYIPVDTSALPPMPSGASCGACTSAPPQNAVAAAQTAADGTFTLTDVPSTDVAPGNPIPLVVQVGKWRRVVNLTSVPRCQTSMVDKDSSRLPRNHLDGAGGHADLPKLAIATGKDPLECLLLKMGVDPSEFNSPDTGTGRIDYYADWDGREFNAPASLVGSPTTLMNYDAVLLPCEGREDDGTNQYADNVSAYANAGGRLLTTHYGYSWLATPTNASANSTNPVTNQPNPYYGVANWSLTPFAVPFSVNAAIATTLPGGQAFPKGQAFASWAQNVGASSTVGSLAIGQTHADVASVNAPTTPWILDPAPGVRPYFFSFDTPIVSGGSDGGSGGACGRVDFSEFHVPATALVDQNAKGQCASDSDCGFTATCKPGTVGTCAPLTGCITDGDCGGSNYECLSGGPGTCVPHACTQNADCAASQQCTQGKCGCTLNSQCASNLCIGGQCLTSTRTCENKGECGSVEDCAGIMFGTCQGTCTVDKQCTQGELCVAGKCSGCNDVSNCPSHVCNSGSPSQCSATSSSFPLMCKQGPMSPEESALEFMLLDLTTCVSPDALPPPASFVSGAGVGVGSGGSNLQDTTFPLDFTSSCPLSTRVVWRELDYDASIPRCGGASIDFSVQTADIPAGGGSPDFSGMMPILLDSAKTSTTSAGAAAYIDTGTQGAFNAANPPVMSKDALRITVTLHPTSDGSEAPTLLDWQVKADCLPTE